MGNCLSSFRAVFRPNRAITDSSPASIPLTPNFDEKPGVEDGNVVEIETEKVLKVHSVDFMIPENAGKHYTDAYQAVTSPTPKLVIRRGYPFKIRIKTNRDYDQDKDALVLVFSVKDEKNPSYSSGTMIMSPVMRPEDGTLPPDSWRSKIDSVEDRAIVIEVTPLANAIVSEWTLVIDTKPRKHDIANPTIINFTCPDSFFILYNPWCQDDLVYLPDPDDRREYIMNDNGLIWRGSHNSLRPSVWLFGQFEESVLECSLYLLSNVGKLPVADRADPIKVVRHLSAVINSSDDNGLIVGNWTGDYKTGTPPTQWSGSQSILQQFYKKKKSVKFGQCWVFSGVCTTVCRALGIPARSITNFSSAHDTHNSLTIDLFYDKEGDPVERLNVDSVWNFHVWNEVWMERPDLEPGGYGGWQAIDATPQESSDGQYRCGPASVAAIKRGEVLKPYDTQFLFAEVNADKVYWRYRGKNKPLKLIQKQSDKIGQLISTKGIGNTKRQDVTLDYKYAEGTNAEREVMLRALRQCHNAFSRYYLNEELEDVEFDLQLLDDIVIGSPFTVHLKVINKNRDGKAYAVEAVLRVDTMLYTGELKKLVKKEKFQIEVPAGKEESIVLRLSYAEYERVLVDQAGFNIAAMASVGETGMDYFAQDDFRVRMPDIIIEPEEDLEEGKEFAVKVHFRNPLPKALRRGVFTIEGPGLGDPVIIKLKEDVPANGNAVAEAKLTPRRGGEKSIAAKFSSRELNDVDGDKTIFVRPINAQPSPETEKPTE